MITARNSATTPPAFPVTRWTLILGLRGEDEKVARRALEELCELYWYPVYAYIRRQGAGPDDAQDMTQGFFARLLERGEFSHAEQSKGKLRTFLLARVQNFMVQDWRHRTAQKRGGGQSPLSLDVAEDRYALEPLDILSPDALFDRRWALDTLETAIARLEREQNAAGKGEVFAALYPFLAAKPQGDDYEAVGAKLGMTTSAIHVAVHRLRQRFRRALESAVAETVASPDEIEEELRHLLSLLLVG